MKNFSCARARVRAVIKEGVKRTTSDNGRAFSPLCINPNIEIADITPNPGCPNKKTAPL